MARLSDQTGSPEGQGQKGVRLSRSPAGALLLAIALLLPAPLLSSTIRYEQTRAAMGTQFTIVAYGADESQLQSAVSAAFEEIFRLDRQWSHYIEESDLSYINRHAAEEPVKVDPELFRFLETCLGYSRETGGAFDVTVGPLLKTWGFFRGTGSLPKKEEVETALARVGWQKVRLDACNRTVAFTVPGVELDLGGIAKGYAVDRAAALLREANIAAALILSGTSSILAIGSPPGQQGWTVKIRDPKDARKSVAEVALKDVALSTSGSYEKFFRAEGKTYSHIFDPHTGYPAQGVLSTTVIGSTGTETDALSTAFFVLGKEGTLRYLKQHSGLRVLFCGEAGCQWLAP